MNNSLRTQRKAVIVSGVRTAIGNFGGSLKDISAVKLGSTVIKEALKKAGLKQVTIEKLQKSSPKNLKGASITDLKITYYDYHNSLQEVQVDEVIMGNVLQGGQGQNPARQATIYAESPRKPLPSQSTRSAPQG